MANANPPIPALLKLDAAPVALAEAAVDEEELASEVSLAFEVMVEAVLVTPVPLVQTPDAGAASPAVKVISAHYSIHCKHGQIVPQNAIDHSHCRVLHLDHHQ